MRTPWGQSDSSKGYGDGVTFYGTPSHGGFRVCPKLNATMPAHLRLPAGWYEEDCEWARVALAFPDRFTGSELLDAEVVLRGYAPEAWEAHYGRALRPGESYMRDKATFEREHVGDFVVAACWGDWHDAVPAGFVAVVARRATDRAETYRLVPQAEYATRNGHAFVVNDTHPVIAAIQ